MKKTLLVLFLIAGFALTFTIRSTSHKTVDFDERDAPEYVGVDFDERDAPEYVGVDFDELDEPEHIST